MPLANTHLFGFDGRRFERNRRVGISRLLLRREFEASNEACCHEYDEQPTNHGQPSTRFERMSTECGCTKEEAGLQARL